MKERDPICCCEYGKALGSTSLPHSNQDVHDLDPFARAVRSAGTRRGPSVRAPAPAGPLTTAWRISDSRERPQQIRRGGQAERRPIEELGGGRTLFESQRHDGEPPSLIRSEIVNAQRPGPGKSRKNSRERHFPVPSRATSLKTVSVQQKIELTAETQESHANANAAVSHPPCEVLRLEISPSAKRRMPHRRVLKMFSALMASSPAKEPPARPTSNRTPASRRGGGQPSGPQTPRFENPASTVGLPTKPR